MKSGVDAYLRDTVDLIDRIETQLLPMSKAMLADDLDAQDATAYRFQHIGEAVKRLPDDLKSRHPMIEWARIIGMRNLLAHEYFAFDPDIAWETMKSSLPSLKAACPAELRTLDSG